MPDINLQEAAEALRKAEKEAIDHCGDEVEAVLAKYGCTMIPQIVVQGMGIVSAQVLIVPRKDGYEHTRNGRGGA